MKYILNIIFLIISIIFTINFMDSSKEQSIDTQKQILIKEAQTHFYNQVNTRHWNAKFGGVYVKPTNDLKPNKYLKNNTLKVDENLTLIKINPAWMTRQLSEQLPSSDFNFRITSLNPINPNNKADQFETKALKFIGKTNKKEYFEFHKDQFKYMGALVTKKSCLSCHAFQGYKVGDIRGGISVSLSSLQYNNIIENLTSKNTIIKYSVILFLIAISILIHIQFRSNEQLHKIVKKRTRQLESEKNYINSLLDTNPDIIIVTNGTKIINANKSFFDIFKYSSMQEFLKDHDCICDYFEKLDGKDFPKDKIIDGKIWAEYLLEHLDANHIVQARINDSLFYFNLHAARLSKDEILVILTNITEYKKQEDQLTKSEKLASMGEMIGNIAHQWRQPLSVISTAATGIKIQNEFGKLDTKELYRLCESIDTNAQYLSKTIDDFKNFIKGDSKPIDFNLKNNTGSFIQIIDSSIKKYNLQVILDLEEDININGYPNELIQCFINIFNNSKDAILENNIDENERYIIISQHIKNDQVIIEFTDNAGGIPQDILPKIFEPYFTTKHQSQGTGLGLHMTYNFIVNGMGGEFKAQNVTFELNDKTYKGAKFTIIIDIVK
ncbi:MAG: DUF3365 domain-containing protein [Campylobacterota bacterium]|nr:DUF3365 domain-containing protein [Campylobacterota bacterium]